MSDLGDIGKFLNASGLPDLDWLDISDEEYRQMAALPKQNLDIKPDLEALWSHEDQDASNFVPNQDRPHTMGDLSPEHGFLRADAEDIRRTARLLVMQTTDADSFQREMLRRFDRSSLRMARSVLAGVLAERGLLGQFYVDASDFPSCHKRKAADQSFVRRYAGNAPYVLAKTACGGCAHACADVTGRRTCGVFQKELVLEVPYTETLAEHIESQQRATGKHVEASQAIPKERIRQAFLAKAPEFQLPAREVQARDEVSAQAAQEHLIAATDLLRKRASAKKTSAQEQEVVDLVRMSLLKGATLTELGASLQCNFTAAQLTSTRAAWEPWLREAGLYGTVYLTQDSFGDCSEGARFVAKHSPQVRAVVAGQKCEGCFYSKMGRCLKYGKKLVWQADDLYTPEVVSQVAWDYKTTSQIQQYDDEGLSVDPRTALKELHQRKMAFSASAATPVLRDRLGAQVAFYGGTDNHQSRRAAVHKIVHAVKAHMNDGLYGSDLLEVLKSQFEIRDLRAAKEDLKVVLAEQGLQGIYYVDPTIYDDYGKGCGKAAALHRSRGVKYAKVGPSCTSCVLQTKEGVCSKLNKVLVVEPPYGNKAAVQQAVLATGKATQTSYADLVNNGATVVAAYEMERRGMSIEVKEASDPEAVSIELGAGSFKV